jgi:hypothetical protein
MTNRIGDRPLFPLSNQRFDKGDAENIARYYEEIISRFTGSIYGQAWGCLSSPQFQVTIGESGPYVTLGKCVLLYSIPDNDTLNSTSADVGPWKAATVLFDPEREGQPLQRLYTNALFSASRRPWILFRRRETQTALGNKAYWDTTTNTEEIGAAPLQQSEYVEFKFATTYTTTDRDGGWFRIAYVDAWGSPANASTPVIIPIHWMDSQYYNDSTPPAQSVAVGSALAYPGFTAAYGLKGFSPVSEMPELAKMMHWVAGKLGQHYSTTAVQQVTEANQATYNVKPGAFVVDYGDTAGGWLSTPPRGLLELDSDLTSLEEELVAQVARLDRSSRLLHALYITPTGTGDWNNTNYAFTVVYDSSAVYPTTAAPTIGRMGTLGGLNAQLRYLFSALETSPLPPGITVQRKILLELECNTTTAYGDFVVNAVQVVPHISPNTQLPGTPGRAANQRYVPTAEWLNPSDFAYTQVAASLPPARALNVEFEVASFEAAEILPFTVYIYGRNV